MTSRIQCPSCGGVQFVQIDTDWYECVSDVIVSGAGPELTGLPHPIHQFGPCGHRFQPSTVVAEERARQQRAAIAAKARAETEVAERSDRDRSIAVLKMSSDLKEILDALEIREGLLPVDTLKSAWRRLLAAGTFSTAEEMLLLEGRGTIPGYFLSRGTYTTQWGRWVELERELVFRVRGAGYEIREGHGETPKTIHEDFDVWFDTSGTLWSDGWSDQPARLSLRDGRPTHRLVINRGEHPRFQRRKAEWMGWEIRVPNAQSAWPHTGEGIQYARALKGALMQAEPG